MNLPYRDGAFVPKGKITQYLLSLNHPVGGSKARFFRACGFDDLNADLLERELLKLAMTVQVSQIEQGEHGTRYVLIGDIQTPNGREVTILTVWIIERMEKNPRFVTAYPV